MVLLFHSVLFFSSKLLFWSQQLGSLPSQTKLINNHFCFDTTTFLDEGYSLSKSLSSKQIVQLALKGCQRNAVDVILTASDVAVEGICSEPLCPGQCAWPFCQPIYGPQSPRLVAPNSDVGLDAFQNISAISLASNPVFHSRMKRLQIDYHFVRERVITDDLLVQHVSSTDISSPKAVLGFMAKDPIQVMLLVESATGASYNAHGVNGRKYLLPALFDPSTSTGA
ncbi:hypothetical protein NC652_006124 [Populus alba x Populus x berolinensis]|nr:hypothetical protein NC652_006124 [Populus alba x Populus x berolinensis]